MWDIWRICVKDSQSFHLGNLCVFMEVYDVCSFDACSGTWKENMKSAMIFEIFTFYEDLWWIQFLFHILFLAAL